jgi:hypothetical protein
MASSEGRPSRAAKPSPQRSPRVIFFSGGPRLLVLLLQKSSRAPINLNTLHPF